MSKRAPHTIQNYQTMNVLPQQASNDELRAAIAAAICHENSASHFPNLFSIPVRKRQDWLEKRFGGPLHRVPECAAHHNARQHLCLLCIQKVCARDLASHLEVHDGAACAGPLQTYGPVGTMLSSVLSMADINDWPLFLTSCRAVGAVFSEDSELNRRWRRHDRALALARLASRPCNTGLQDALIEQVVGRYPDVASDRFWRELLTNLSSTNCDSNLAYVPDELLSERLLYWRLRHTQRLATVPRVRRTLRMFGLCASERLSGALDLLPDELGSSEAAVTMWMEARESGLEDFVGDLRVDLRDDYADESLYDRALDSCPRAFYRLPDSKRTLERCRLAVDRYAGNITHVPCEHQSAELCVLAVEKNAYIYDIPERFRQHKLVQKALAARPKPRYGGGGGLLSLVAFGAQDRMLTGAGTATGTGTFWF